MIVNVSAKSLSILSVQHRQKAESEEYIMTLKDFFHELNATCTIWRKIYISIILSAFVLVVDELDWPTTIFSKFPWIWMKPYFRTKNNGVPILSKDEIGIKCLLNRQIGYWRIVIWGHCTPLIHMKTL